MVNGSGDPLVIRTAELAPYIERTIRQFNGDSAPFAKQWDEAPSDWIQTFGVWNWMEQETGIPQRGIYRIHRLETKHTSLEIADKLLSGLGFPHAISSGEVKVIPNPRWTQEKWVQYVRERGCEPDDLLG